VTTRKENETYMNKLHILLLLINILWFTLVAFRAFSEYRKYLETGSNAHKNLFLSHFLLIILIAFFLVQYFLYNHLSYHLHMAFVAMSILIIGGVLFFRIKSKKGCSK